MTIKRLISPLSNVPDESGPLDDDEKEAQQNLDRVVLELHSQEK